MNVTLSLSDFDSGIVGMLKNHVSDWFVFVIFFRSYRLCDGDMPRMFFTYVVNEEILLTSLAVAFAKSAQPFVSPKAGGCMGLRRKIRYLLRSSTARSDQKWLRAPNRGGRMWQSFVDVVVVLQGLGAVSSRILKMPSKFNYAEVPYFYGHLFWCSVIILIFF